MDNSRVGAFVEIQKNAFVGKNVKVSSHTFVCEGVTIEDDVFVGPSAVFTNVINPRSQVARKNEYRQTLVRRGASIGANATIVCGHTIGKYAFIGAGTVVTRDIPAYAMVVGNPGRIRGWVCECGAKLPLDASANHKADAACTECGKVYRRTRESLQLISESAGALCLP